MEYGLRHGVKATKDMICTVLILVVMEYGLRRSVLLSIKKARVLILVVMEYGLRRHRQAVGRAARGGLNPCCNGIWSQTHFVPVNFKFLCQLS